MSPCGQQCSLTIGGISDLFRIVLQMGTQLLIWSQYLSRSSNWVQKTMQWMRWWATSPTTLSSTRWSGQKGRFSLLKWASRVSVLCLDRSFVKLVNISPTCGPERVTFWGWGFAKYISFGLKHFRDAFSSISASFRSLVSVVSLSPAKATKNIINILNSRKYIVSDAIGVCVMLVNKQTNNLNHFHKGHHIQ